MVVGNWVVGGAGKTPTTLALLQHLQGSGWRPGVVSRGHGSRTDAAREVLADVDTAEAVGDEPLLLARRARVPVCVARDRRAALRLLLSRHPLVDIVIADDGLQHHRLHRDLAVVAVDERGAGNGLCLPAGPLREPVPPRLPADTVLLYTGGRPSLDLPGHIGQRILRGVQPFAAWSRGEPLPEDGGWTALQGRTVQAVAGVAKPERFFDQLRQQGLTIEPIALPDHAPFARLPWSAHASDVVMTEKDAVKAGPWSHGSTRLWVARLDLVPPPTFWAELDHRLMPWTTD